MYILQKYGVRASESSSNKTNSLLKIKLTSPCLLFLFYAFSRYVYLISFVLLTLKLEWCSCCFVLHTTLSNDRFINGANHQLLQVSTGLVKLLEKCA